MRRKWLLLLVPMVAGVVLAADYLSTPARDLRQFDPIEVARLDTVMWRAYYDRERLTLLRQLAQLLRQQYHLSRTQSVTTAYHAAKAALIFKDGHTREDYEKALPDLVAFYRVILGPERPPDQTAKLELEWWIIHRERASRPPGELDNALAQLQAEIYEQPADAFLEHGRLRAQAMLIRDEKAEQGNVSEEDWAHIRVLLDQSWTALHTAVAR